MDAEEAERRRLISPQRPTICTALEIYQCNDCAGTQSSEYGLKEDVADSTSCVNWCVDYKIVKFPSPPKFLTASFKTEKEAQEFFKKNQGLQIVDLILARDFSEEEVRDVQDLIENNEVSASSYFGTEFDYELPSSILELCGIIDENGEPTRKVLRRLGEERVAFLKNKHTDDWQVVAEMEYAMCSLSTESPAYIATAVLYYFHISKEFLLAGYLLRDLIAVYSGADQEHISQLYRKRNSGEASTKVTAKSIPEKRKILVTRMADFLKKSKNIPSERPLTAERLGLEAARHLKKYRNRYWSKGDEGSVEGHLTAVRSNKIGTYWMKKLRNIEIVLEKSYKS